MFASKPEFSVGSWSIDFPAHTSDGIFAITGPTGAGRPPFRHLPGIIRYTPRLNRITKNNNKHVLAHRGLLCGSVL